MLKECAALNGLFETFSFLGAGSRLVVLYVTLNVLMYIYFATGGGRNLAGVRHSPVNFYDAQILESSSKLYIFLAVYLVAGVLGA